MKKYLMTGIAAVAMCAAFTSCSKDIEQVSQEQIDQANAQKIVADYEAAFIKAFGQPAASQDWGFGINATRSTEKEDHTLIKDFGLVKPTLKEGEAAYVMNWFRTNPDENSVGLDITKFFIIYVGGNTTVNVHKHEWDMNYYNNNKNKGATSNFSDEYFERNVVLDYLHINGEHILDWNANGGVTEYVYNSKADNFRARNSYIIDGGQSLTTTKWKLAKITYNGEEGWYVGLSAYGKKQMGSYETLPGSGVYEDRAEYTDYDRENYYDDWVFKIVPAEAVPSGDGCIIAEDLSAEESSDFDFNDVVFNYKYTSTGVDITLRAAGGTLPLRLAGNDAYEVHKLFGVETNVMVNTGLVSKDPVSFSITGTFDSTKNGDDILVEVNKGTKENPNWIPLTAVKGRVASKVRVDIDYEWCTEREDIDDKYCATHDHFTEYVGGQWAWNTWYKQQ